MNLDVLDKYKVYFGHPLTVKSTQCTSYPLTYLIFIYLP